MKRTLLPLLGLAIASIAPAQDVSKYLALRKLHGIKQAVGVEALETLVGTRTVEVRGVVKGTFRVGDTDSLLLERPDGETYVIDAQEMPMWLVGSNVTARLLVRASREGEYGPLVAKLLGACPDGPISQIEARQRKTVTTTKSRPSSGLYGPIGKSHSHSVSRGSGWSLPASQVTPIYASFIHSRNHRLSKAEAMRIAEGIVGFSLRYGVDARLIMAMVMVESGFDPTARSRAGAMGLGQLMPGTAQWMGVGNAYDSIDNLYGTVKLIRTHIDDYRRRTGDEYQSIVLALAAYNAGIGAVSRHGGVPPYRETQSYVRKVISLYMGFMGQR